MEVNLPEGLHRQSIDFITSWIANNGFNCVRLTYSIDMALNSSVSVSDSFINAAAPANVSTSDMISLYNQALVKNPFLANATRLDVFAKIIDTLNEKGVHTILDNHVSRASWCCDLQDGNGWWDTAVGYVPWNSRFFHTNEWLEGLNVMAEFSLSHPGVVAMSIRNEIRPFPLFQNYNNNDDWYKYVTQAAKTVHAVNPDVLIIIGGSQSSTDLSFVGSRPLDTSAWAGKHVWEFHAYPFTVTLPNPTRSCFIANAEYGFLDGFVLRQNQSYTAPLILSEFGVAMTGGPYQGLSDDHYGYLTCLVKYMESNDADFAVWAIQGSYYVRSSTVDYNETWGLLTHDWSELRNPAFPGMLGKMWQMTQGPDTTSWVDNMDEL